MSDDSRDIHAWFELTYAQYLTIPRSVLQSMPEEWQHRFVQCLDELDATIDWRPARGQYRVQLREVVERWSKAEGMFVQRWGKEIDDPLMDYERGRRHVPHRPDRRRRAHRLRHSRLRWNLGSGKCASRLHCTTRSRVGCMRSAASPSTGADES